MKFLLLLLLLLSLSAQARPAQVLLLRHGEKPESGYDLSDKGWQRAKALPELFTRPVFSAHGAPVALFAQTPQSDGSQIRPFLTLKYVAEETRLAIDTRFDRDDPESLAKEILHNDAYDGKLVVVCWEHKVLSDIARALGVRPTPAYPDDRYDRAWLLTYAAPDAAPKFEDLPEFLLPDDEDK